MHPHPVCLTERSPLVAELAGTCCANCGAMLTLHQPIVEQADRFLGTCDECKAWYVSSRRPVGLVRIPLPEPIVLFP
jgi:hypothetical protein